MARTKYYPHEKVLKINEVKVSDLPIEIQSQIKDWRKNKEIGYHQRYVSESEKISKGIEKYIESDIESLYVDIEKQPIPNHSHRIGFIPQNEVKSNSEPQKEIKKDIEKQSIPYHSNTIGFLPQKEVKSSSKPQKDIEKDIELQPIPNHSEINTVLPQKEVKSNSEPQNDVELQAIPNHSEINGSLSKQEQNVMTEKVIGLCPTFCKKIGTIQTACYGMLKYSEKENIEPIFNLQELEDLGVKRGFWSEFSSSFGYKGKYFKIKRLGKSYEVISLQPFPNEAFIEIDAQSLIEEKKEPKKVNELDFTDFNKVSNFISCHVSNSIQEAKFYESLTKVEKYCYDLLKDAKKHTIATFEQLKENAIKIGNEGFESEYFRIVPLKENAFRITRKNCNI